jgi:hypothetical protein
VTANLQAVLGRKIDYYVSGAEDVAVLRLAYQAELEDVFRRDDEVKDVEVSFVDTGVGTGAAIITREP